MSFVLVGMGLSVGGAVLGYTSANKAQRKAERKAAKAQEEMDRLKDVYASLDTSNPYADMENTMEDLTVDQKAYDLEKQQFQQSQSDVLGGLREAAGSSGVAAVAQALAGESQKAAQSSASRIGQQERENQMSERRMAANLQDKERQGEIWSRNSERDKQATLLGMSQQEVAAYREQAAAAQQAKWDAIAGGVSAVGSMLQGVGASGGEVCCEADFEPPEPESEVFDQSGPSYLDNPAPCPGLV
tara:strand:+ start:1910 stop:2641 length:732 start_codon:yes stop_codon:yes gene_type:complete